MADTGIGGLFFRARDPEGLLAWYRRHLGIAPDTPWVWQQAAGPTVFAPFPADSTYFPADRQWMLNLRVSGLDALVAALAAAGIAAERRTEGVLHDDTRVVVPPPHRPLRCAVSQPVPGGR